MKGINKKGFTLVELLAVMVVLAIIALMAVPVVTDTIRKAKDKASLANAEIYVKSAHEAILEYKIDDKEKFYPETCTVSGKTLTCGDITIKVKAKGTMPDSGTIVYENEEIVKVELKYGKKTIVNNKKGILIFEGTDEKTLDTICTHDTTNGVSAKTAGAKYTCEVKEGTSYNFYVLTTPKEGDTTINLIMDRNICEDGTLATAENKCTVAWISNEQYYGGAIPDKVLNDGDLCQYGGFCSFNDKGPVTAMDYLYNATKDWTNIPNIEMNYTDEGNTGDYGYGTIVTTDNITKITKKDGTAVTVLTDQEGYSNLKARLPYKSEVSRYDSTNKTNAYLYDYLDQSGPIQTNTISGISGYWTFSSNAGNPYNAWDVYFGGSVDFLNVVYDSYHGVRAVINLKI